jgi:hypothetical protein
MTMNRLLFSSLLSAAAAAASIAVPATAGETLWTTNPNMPTLYSSGMIGPSVQTPQTNKEVADDFNVIGLIEEVLADGDDCPGCFCCQPVTGVFVRFYEWTASGPGALQSEQFLGASDPNFNWTPGYGPEFLQITLPEPFQATGWHYVSVQVTFSAENAGTGKWSFHPVNWGATMGDGVKIRDNNAGGTWAPFPGTTRDASFALIGTPGQAPSMSILSATSEPITPSARLRVTGDGFGDAQGNGHVLINGAASFVTTWTNSVLVAYVPEQTALGNAELTVVNDAGESDTLSIQVQPREADGRVQWRFAVDADIIRHRVGLAPAPGGDGSIYINAYNGGRLYKLTPDGGLVWIVDALRGQIGSGAEGPVIVGEDGTVYVAVNPLGPTVEIVAYNPDGTLKWVFTNPFAVGTLTGPAFGPDGNIYATYSIVADGQMGAISLTTEGDLRWFSSGEPFINHNAIIGAELAFSSSTLGGPTDQIVCATSSDLQSVIYGLSMEDGDTNWSHTFSGGGWYLMQLHHEAATGPDGTVYMTESAVGPTGRALRARHPSDGTPSWYFSPGIVSEATAPVVGSDGVIYFGWDLARITAVSPQGNHIWTYDGGTGGVRRMPAISPNNEVVIFGGGPFGQSGYIKALDAQDGSAFFQVDLATSAGTIFPVDRPAFTPDSATVYCPTGIVNNPGNPHAYVYAITIAEPSRPGDINGDGVVDVFDLLMLLGAWGNCGAGQCPADLNGDGVVDVFDLLTLLANWG